MRSGCRTIGLVLLLSACGGNVARDLGTEAESDHKILRINVLCAVGNTGSSPTPCLCSTPTDLAEGPSAEPVYRSPSGVWGSPGTLLSLGCLLSV